MARCALRRNGRSLVTVYAVVVLSAVSRRVTGYVVESTRPTPKDTGGVSKVFEAQTNEALCTDTTSCATPLRPSSTVVSR
ncbi:hypothetical protein FQZ97_1233370 [compost metagenome]